jgi:hypothetical protein
MARSRRVTCPFGASPRLACQFDTDSRPGQTDYDGPRRLARSKPTETTRYPGPFRLSHERPHRAGFMVRDRALRASEVRDRLRCKFGRGTRAISDADHQRVGPR